MDLYIDRDELGRGLARVQGIIERRSTHPLLSHVLLHALGFVAWIGVDREIRDAATIEALHQKPPMTVRTIPSRVADFSS